MGITTLQNAYSQTIINTEKLQSYAKPGWFAGLQSDINLERGNSEVFEISGQSIIGYQQTHHAVKLLSGFKYLTENQNSITSRNFLQVRYNYIFNSAYRTFTFYQYQHNKSLILNSRQIIGAGLRRKFGSKDLPTFHLGMGLMYENERLNRSKLLPGETSNLNALRIDAIGYFTYGITSNTTLINSTYYQPAVSDFGDFRLFDEMSLSVAINKYAELNLSFLWRYDHQPPGTLKKYDINITTGIGIHI